MYKILKYNMFNKWQNKEIKIDFFKLIIIIISWWIKIKSENYKNRIKELKMRSKSKSINNINFKFKILHQNKVKSKRI